MDNQNTGMEKNSALKFITPAVAVLIIAAAAIWMTNKPAATMPAEQTPATPNNDTSGEQTTQTPTNTTPVASEKKYKAGSYAATGDYQSPGGHDQLGVTVMIDENGVIKSSKVDPMPSNPASKKWQGIFMEGFSAEVVGKPIDQVSLSVVNGSSLTPKGFMDALEKIKVQASAQS